MEVRPDPKDKRSRLITLTPEGLSLLSRAVPIWEETHRAVEALAGGEADRLRTHLLALS